jgi:hypothetical protein
MKKRKLFWLFVLVPPLAAVLASVFASSSSRSKSATATAPTLDEPPTLMPSATREQAPLPAQGGQNIWKRPPLPDDPVKREVRLQLEPGLMETAGKAVEAAIPVMGFTEEEGSQIRQAFAAYKDGCLRVLRGPGAFRSDSDPAEAALPWNMYHHQLREILGEERAEKFEDEYRAQRLTVTRTR